MNNDLGNFIKKARAEKHLSLRKLATLTGLSHSYLHILENGTDRRSGNSPSISLVALRKLAAGLDVPLAELIAAVQDNSEGVLLPLEVAEPKTGAALELKGENIQMVPIYEELSAELPDHKSRAVKGWCPVDIVAHSIARDEIHKYFYLRIRDNSMEPIINEQDLVLIKQGPVEDGQIGAIVCKESICGIRKIHRMQSENLLMLVSRNPAYDPITIRLSDCKVLGRVVLRMGEPAWK